MSSTKSSQFFWSDWRNDPGLRLCSFAARGLWIDMLTLAAEAEPRGYVTVAGQPLGPVELARILGGSPDEIALLLAELERNGVFSRVQRTGTIYSRRMVRDARLAAVSRENGRKGGNPSLRKKSGKSGRVNPPDNAALDIPYPSLTDVRESITNTPAAAACPNGSARASPEPSPAAAASDPPPTCSVEAEALGDEVQAILGTNGQAWAWAGMHVHRWQQAGATADQIRAVARGLRQRCDATGRAPPRQPSYLDPIIADAIAAGHAPMPQGHGPPAGGAAPQPRIDVRAVLDRLDQEDRERELRRTDP